MRKIYLFFASVCIAAVFSGCAVKVGVDANRTLSGEENTQAVKVALTHGDWLVTRGIHDTDNFIAGVTNMPLSHAAIYDADNDWVIEADGSGVHTTALRDFLAKSQRVMVIVPIWADEQTRTAAVKRAGGWIGLGYNYTGLVGLDAPNRFYCTQLAIDAYKDAINANPPQNPLPQVVKPGQMYHWGRIVYDSGAIK
ncbi:MAG: hypothetical protein LBQ18_00790 [Campylobacteraceae bacterium]|jgi:uncharacterized protein YycO|nr:hypothetical protein [Campylobacteraceae bacterium]